MSEDTKKPSEEESAVVRKLVVPKTEAACKDGPRSPKNDRDFQSKSVAEAAEEAESVRKPIVIVEQNEVE